MVDKEQIELMEQRIQRFNDFVMAQDIDKMPVGLFCGKLGLSIYFYHQANTSLNKLYKNFADKLLKSTISQLHTKTIINLEDGLIGVCLGINYIIENKFQKGNVNHILSELDDKIYQKAWFENLNNNSGHIENLNAIVEIAYYFCTRLKNKNIDKNNRILFESIVIKSINQIENSGYFTDKFLEPLSFTINGYFLTNYFHLLGMVNSLEFYSYKINKIIDEMYPNLYSVYPFLQTNRLQLISALKHLNVSLNRTTIDQLIFRLTVNIDFEYIIKNEFQDQNLLLANGLCGMYMLNSILFKNNEMCSDFIIQRIYSSGIWSDIIDNRSRQESTIGLFTGLAGVILTYQQLLNQRNEI